ncbi:hypothetical protein QP157_12380 [Sphingomonas sp. LR61]|uniref:hypothetical protein n=1 Tax=Sphingomonas sp. LR61 TaxID=3050234 RepID=UPI002FE09F29
MLVPHRLDQRRDRCCTPFDSSRTLVEHDEHLDDRTVGDGLEADGLGTPAADDQAGVGRGQPGSEGGNRGDGPHDPLVVGEHHSLLLAQTDSDRDLLHHVGAFRSGSARAFPCASSGA